ALVERHGPGVTPALGGVKALPRNIPRRSDLTSCFAAARSLVPTGDARRHRTRVLERDECLVARPRRERGTELHEAAAHRERLRPGLPGRRRARRGRGRVIIAVRSALQPLGTVELAELAVERAERQVAGF